MARNSSGTHTLPAGNPVVTGTTVSSTWANTTEADISTEITDSLSRSGKGGMLAPLRSVNGSISAPQYSWTSESNTGLYRAGTNDVRMAVAGADAFAWGLQDVTAKLRLRVPDGSAGSPGVTFDNDTDTGLYRVGTNDMAAAVAGAGVTEWVSTGLKILPASPAATTAFANQLTRLNIAKAWAVVTLNSTVAPALTDGFSIASVLADASYVQITFAQPFADTNFAVDVTVEHATTQHIARIVGKTPTTVQIALTSITVASPAVTANVSPSGATGPVLHVAAFGRQ